MQHQPVDNEYIQAIREQIKAEHNTALELKRQNDLAQERIELDEKTLRALNRTVTTEQTRVKFWAEISEKTAAIVNSLPEVNLLLIGFDEKLTEYGTNLEILSSRLDRIEYGIMLLLSGKGNGNRNKTRALVRDIEKDRQRLLEQHYRTLHELQIQLASYGIDKPVHITMAIEDIEREIDKLEDGHS